ncbi:hypothetical protein A2U01_0110653, partial [Trifolium medium]|nr:hypothetical protein [Trifolium medium]
MLLTYPLGYEWSSRIVRRFEDDV